MVETILYDIPIVLVKVSILLQYVTVFVVHRKRFFHLLIHVIIWGNVILYAAITLAFVFRVSLAISTKQHQIFKSIDIRTVRTSTKVVASQDSRSLSWKRSGDHVRSYQRCDGFFDSDLTVAGTPSAAYAYQKKTSTSFCVRCRALRVYCKRCALCL